MASPLTTMGELDFGLGWVLEEEQIVGWRCRSRVAVHAGQCLLPQAGPMHSCGGCHHVPTLCPQAAPGLTSGCRWTTTISTVIPTTLVPPAFARLPCSLYDRDKEAPPSLPESLTGPTPAAPPPPAAQQALQPQQQAAVVLEGRGATADEEAARVRRELDVRAAFTGLPKVSPHWTHR